MYVYVCMCVCMHGLDVCIRLGIMFSITPSSLSAVFKLIAYNYYVTEDQLTTDLNCEKKARVVMFHVDQDSYINIAKI